MKLLALIMSLGMNGSAQIQDANPPHLKQVQIQFNVVHIPATHKFTVTGSRFAKVGSTSFFNLVNDDLLTQFTKSKPEKGVIVKAGSIIMTLDGIPCEASYRSENPLAVMTVQALPRVLSDGSLELKFGSKFTLGKEGEEGSRSIWSFDRTQVISKNEIILARMKFKDIDGTARQALVFVRASVNDQEIKE